MSAPTGQKVDTRTVVRRTGGSVLGGWMAGAVGHELLVRFMLGRGWLAQSDTLTPEPLSLGMLVVGLVVAGGVALADARSTTDRTSTRWATARAVGTAGVVMVGLGLWHAHAIGQLLISEEGAAFWIDQLYHDPGIALVVAGWYLRPTARRR